MLVVLTLRAEGEVVLGEALAETARAAAVAGWIKAEKDRACWRLTGQGRVYLKRMLSGARGQAEPEPTARAAAESRACPKINDAESPLAWLSRRRGKDGRAMISDAEFDAGERLRADFWFAQMTPRVTANWSAMAPNARCRRAPPGAGIDIQDNVIAARERVQRALATVGPELAGILIDVCCHLKGLEDIERAAGWPQRSGKVVLKFALSRLARHYGMGRASPQDGAVPRVRHWGSADYRPRVDASVD